MSKVNAWKYGREVYLIGRSNKFRYLTEQEREYVITFITEILKTRKSIAARLNLKYENAGKELAKQNSYALLKMVQVIGRNFKVQFPTEEEKALCDTLIEKVVPRAVMGYKNYAVDVVEEQTDETVEEGTVTETTTETTVEENTTQQNVQQETEQSETTEE